MNFDLKRSSTDFNTFIALLLTVSVFLPYYISLATIFAIAIMTVINYKKRAKAFSEPYSKFIVCVMIGGFLISALYSNQLGLVYSLVIIAILITGFYIRSIMTRQLFNKMMDLACVSSVACAVIALCQKIAVFGTSPNYRPISTFFNANYYGMMIEFVVIIAIYRLLTNKQNIKFYLAVIAMNLLGLYLAASMSSFIAMSFAAVVILLFKGRFKLTALFVIAVGSFIGASMLFPGLFPRVEDIDHTFDQRLLIWSATLKGIKLHPLFGQGPVTYQLIYSQFDGYKTFHCHNLFLDILLNYGFVGAAAIAFYAFKQMKSLIERFKNNICSNMNILVAAITVATIVHGCTDVTIFWIQTGMMFMLIFSSTGVHSVYTDRNPHAAGALLPGYANRVGAHATYYKN